MLLVVVLKFVELNLVDFVVVLLFLKSDFLVFVEVLKVGLVWLLLLNRFLFVLLLFLNVLFVVVEELKLLELKLLFVLLLLVEVLKRLVLVVLVVGVELNVGLVLNLLFVFELKFLFMLVWLFCIVLFMKGSILELLNVEGVFCWLLLLLKRLFLELFVLKLLVLDVLNFVNCVRLLDFLLIEGDDSGDLFDVVLFWLKLLLLKLVLDC